MKLHCCNIFIKEIFKFGKTIGYDLNGNMTTMPDKGISSIKYNYLNLPNDLHIYRFGNEYVTIKTKYGADGTKLAKENTTTIAGIMGFVTTINTTDYLDGFQYLRKENPNTVEEVRKCF